MVVANKEEVVKSFFRFLFGVFIGWFPSPVCYRSGFSGSGGLMVVGNKQLVFKSMKLSLTWLDAVVDALSSSGFIGF